MVDVVAFVQNVFGSLADPILIAIAKHRVAAFVIALGIWITFARFNILTWIAGLLFLVVIILIKTIPLELTEMLTAIAILLYLIGFIVTIPIAVIIFGYIIYKLLIAYHQKLAMQYAEMSPEDLAGRKKPKSVTIILGDEE